MQGHSSGALKLPTGCTGPGVSWVVQAKVSPHLCFAQGILPELESNLRWLLLLLGMEVPGETKL